MASVDALIKELDGIPSYLQESALLVPDVTKLKAAQAITIKAKLQILSSLSLSDATRLKRAISSVGWSETENSEIAAIVDDAVANSSPSKKMRRANQRCLTWEFYPTDKDWELFCDSGTPWSIKYERAKIVCRKIGLLLPSETTRGRILDVLLLANKLPIERDSGFYKSLEKLSAVLDPLHRETFRGGGHIIDFPTSPKDLPAKHYSYSYPEDLPAMREFIELGHGTKDVRRSSNAYKRSQTLVTTVTPTAPREDTLMAMLSGLGEPTSPLQAMAAALLATLARPTSSNGPCMHNVRELPPPAASKSPKIEEVEPEPKPDEASEQSEPEEPAAADERMRKALAARRGSTSKILKRPAAQAAKGKPTPKKACAREASARKAKKPRAKETCAREGYRPPKSLPWEAADKKRKRNTFTCLWYNRTQVKLRAAGWDLEKQKAELSRILTLAGRLWDRHMK